MAEGCRPDTRRLTRMGRRGAVAVRRWSSASSPTCTARSLTAAADLAGVLPVQLKLGGLVRSPPWSSSPACSWSSVPACSWSSSSSATAALMSAAAARARRGLHLAAADRRRGRAHQHAPDRARRRAPGSARAQRLPPWRRPRRGPRVRRGLHYIAADRLHASVPLVERAGVVLVERAGVVQLDLGDRRTDVRAVARARRGLHHVAPQSPQWSSSPACSWSSSSLATAALMSSAPRPSSSARSAPRRRRSPPIARLPACSWSSVPACSWSSSSLATACQPRRGPSSARSAPRRRRRRGRSRQRAPGPARAPLSRGLPPGAICTMSLPIAAAVELAGRRSKVALDVGLVRSHKRRVGLLMDHNFVARDRSKLRRVFWVSLRRKTRLLIDCLRLKLLPQGSRFGIRIPLGVGEHLRRFFHPRSTNRRISHRDGQRLSCVMGCRHARTVEHRYRSAPESRKTRRLH